MTHQTIVPAFRANNAQALIDWLRDTFGFAEHLVVPDGEGGIAHAQLEWRGSLVMLGSARGHADFMDVTIGRASLSLTAESAEQVDDLYRRAQDAGAPIVTPLEETEYGSHAFTTQDPEGNFWHFGTYDPLAPMTEQES
ncbi:MAG: glyoxalase [Chloroflexi bacterium]|nr:VOC family protein [Chloroflexota bacterium]MCY3589034.1 VOC family protein [Chloroflexota bacterium]MCY3684794.1 VOC family protein [Chloroflexota bacterium]MDE2709769.1 VOC family protein [Chloroflexota bacterium]MDE2986848.1 VOC family protein [Chloroflexota bacterium]